jgi:Tfp pilus assembly protein PilW
MRPALRAFSLLELLVAVALLAVIIVGLLAMFSQVQRALKSGLTQVDVMEGGRATMALITRDLRDMVAVPITNAPSFQALYEPTAPGLSLAQAGGKVLMADVQNLSFLTRAGDDWTGIAYRVGNSNAPTVTNAAAGVGTLYRLTATTAPTVPTDLTGYYNFPTNVANLAHFITNVAMANFVNPLTPANRFYSNTEFHRVLDGVVNFTVNAYDANGRLLTNSMVPSVANFQGYVCTNQFDLASGVITNVSLPAFIEVELAVLEPAVLAKYQARLDSGGLAAATNYLAGKAGQVHVFRQRVAIRPAATRIAPGT